MEVFCDTLGVTSVTDAEMERFTLQPNPARETVRLNLPTVWEVSGVVVRDAAGREVLAPAGSSSASTPTRTAP